MQRGNDRLAFVADDVSGVVIVLVVRWHHVESHRLDFLAGIAPHVWEVLKSIRHVSRPGSRRGGSPSAGAADDPCRTDCSWGTACPPRRTRTHARHPTG